MLIDNRDFLRLGHRQVLLELEEAKESNDVIIEPSKKGLQTMKVLVNEKSQYIHSKYDPENEAEKLINQLQDMDESRHVLFIGTGLGYHIQKLLTKYPRLNYSIYEPDLTVLKHFFANFNVKNFPKSTLHELITSRDMDKVNCVIGNLLGNNETLFIYSLPSYSELYTNEINGIMEVLKVQLKSKRNNLAVNASFQTRWTINSLKNFLAVLQTPNILTDVDQAAFEGKPAIIVAAGPSLNEEFENLRHIKEHGLAYIFSVGSAINALVEKGIYPDAACTYDPSEKNQYVMQKIKDLNIDNIPLIFGSSVGYETIENYPGDKLHMFTSQDSVSPYLVNKNMANSTVMDASSIAVVTFQLLTLLKCDLIVLVGQNLGYQNNKRYASGIEYDFINNEVTEKEVMNSVKTKDVYGNEIVTNEWFNLMRLQMEKYISDSSGIQVINTSKGGAQIEGTKFMHLEDVISTNLTQSIVLKGWYKANNDYKLKTVSSKIEKLKIEQKQFVRDLNITLSKLAQIRETTRLRNHNQIERSIYNFEKSFDKVKSNEFYTIFIEPIIKNSKTVLSEKNSKTRFEKDKLKKGMLVVENYEIYLEECDRALEYILPSFLEIDSANLLEIKGGAR